MKLDKKIALYFILIIQLLFIGSILTLVITKMDERSQKDTWYEDLVNRDIMIPESPVYNYPCTGVKGDKFCDKEKKILCDKDGYVYSSKTKETVVFLDKMVKCDFKNK